MGWQWSNLEKVLDPWLGNQQDEGRRGSLLEAMALMAERPDEIDDEGVPNRSPLVRQLSVESAGVVLLYLRAQQFRTYRLLAIRDDES